MPVKLGREEIVTIGVLKAKGQPNTDIARTLGITEGTVRYHLQRAAEGAVDGRKGKPHKADAYAALIDRWVTEERGPRPANVADIHDRLVMEHGYEGTYRSVLRFVRSKYPPPKIRTYRRVETPPGAQAQADWAERRGVDLGDGLQTAYAFFLTLSHSRKPAVVWSLRTDQLAWHDCHTEALRRLGGVPATIRIDNLKTGIASGAGPWGEVNRAYRAYAKAAGFHVDACLPRAPEDKGKVERRIGAAMRHIDPRRRSFPGGLAELQAWTDERLERLGRRWKCPATGTQIEEAWLDEIPRLGPLDRLPEVFEVAVRRKVHKDCTVNFEGRTYSVPFRLVGLSVEVRGCARSVQVFHDGRVVAEHPRGTKERIVIDPAHYEGPEDDRVQAPPPLGRLGRRLVEIATMPVETRPVDIYESLVEVAR